MVDYGIDQTFSNDESVEYPPPPPAYPPPYDDEAGYSDDAGYSNDAGYSDEPNDLSFDERENDYEFEHTLSEHNLNAKPYDYEEEYDSIVVTDSETVESKKRNPLSKKAILGTLALVLMVIVVALSAATTARNKQANQASAAVAESNAAIVAPTDRPSNSPTRAITESSPRPSESPVGDYDHQVSPYDPNASPNGAPSEHHPASAPHNRPSPSGPNASPNGAPSEHHPASAPHNMPSHSYPAHGDLATTPNHLPLRPIHDKVFIENTSPDYPDAFCQDEINVSKPCYTFGESIVIDYKICNPGEHDWLGVFRPNSCDRVGRMRTMPIYWEMYCGGHKKSCDSPKRSGTMTISANVGAGHYMVYAIESYARPYQSTASTAGFRVARRCPKNPSYHD